MTLKIIKPKQTEPQPEFDADAARTSLIAGMVSDAVYDKHTAVEATGARDWDQVASIYKELEDELKMLSSMADELAGGGLTSSDIAVTVGFAATAFQAADIQKMKKEQHGTVTKWLNAMKV